MNGGAYVTSQRVLGTLLSAVGVLMVVSTIARGGGPLALGTIVGLLFALLGAARVWLVRPREAEADR